MKTLYITDLDGTLLNSQAQISQNSVSLLNDLIDKGALFSLATARTYSTVVPIMKDVNLNTPVVLMNGVCLYDITQRKMQDVHFLEMETVRQIVDVFLKHGKYPMLYFENEGAITVEYTVLSTQSQIDYVSNRKKFYNKNFLKRDSFLLDDSRKCIYIVTLDKYDEIKEIAHEIENSFDVGCHFYSDNYCGEYFLEIFNKHASKSSGVQKVKDILNADKIIAFGDNLNDSPMFEIADEAYAVKNAVTQLKEKATGVIDSNNEDAVARFIFEHFQKENQ